MKPTITYWLVIVGLCVLFPPLLGFVLGGNIALDADLEGTYQQAMREAES